MAADQRPANPEDRMLTTFADDSERSAMALHRGIREYRQGDRRWMWDGQRWYLTTEPSSAPVD